MSSSSSSHRETVESVCAALETEVGIESKPQRRLGLRALNMASLAGQAFMETSDSEYQRPPASSRRGKSKDDTIDSRNLRHRYKQMKSLMAGQAFKQDVESQSEGIDDNSFSGSQLSTDTKGSFATASFAGQAFADTVNNGEHSDGSVCGSQRSTRIKGKLAMASLAGQAFMDTIEVESRDGHQQRDTEKEESPRRNKSPRRKHGHNSPHNVAATTKLASKVKTAVGSNSDSKGSGSAALIRHVPVGEELDASFTDPTLQLADWDRQLDEVDQKQAELFTTQWRMIREQTTKFAHELASVQRQLKDLKKDSYDALHTVERNFQENEAKFADCRSQAISNCESLEVRLMKKVKHDVEAESKHRVAGDDGAQKRLDEFIKDVLEALESKAQELAAAHAEMQHLRNELSAKDQEVDALKVSLFEETKERKAFEKTMAQKLGDLREELLKEVRERAAADDALSQGLHSALDHERSERESSHGLARRVCATLEQEMQTQKEDLSSLRRRVQDSLQESDNILQLRLKEHQKGLERELGEHTAAHTQLDQRISEIRIRMEKEAAARAAMAEDTDQLFRTCQAKSKSLISEHAESAKQSLLHLQNTLQGKLEKERATREAQHDAVNDQLLNQRSSVESRFEALEADIREVEQKYQDEHAQGMHSWEVSQQKLADELNRQARDLRDVFQGRLAEERTAREAKDVLLEERVEFLDQFLQDMRELFVNKGSLQRHIVTSRSAIASGGA